MILRDYQNRAVASPFDYWMNGGKGNPVIGMPTGSGKSLVIAEFNRLAVTQYPQTRILNLTHSRELIRQNHDKLKDLWSFAPSGILSAGLNRRDFGFPITFAGIGSIVKHAEKFKHTNLITIDECHTVSVKENAMYSRFLKEIKEYNPKVKVLGLSATLYRMGSGSIVSPGSIFTDVCLDLTSMHEFNRFIDEGYLVPLIPRPTDTELDVSSVRMSAGDYNMHDLQAAVDKDSITRAAVSEMIEKGQGRKSWLIFASGIEHSIHVANMLGEMGVSAVAVHSSTKDFPMSNELRDSYVNAFKRGEIQALVNNGCFTTGFDHPAIDLIGVLRPTKSPGLWVQMLGRGTRPDWQLGLINCKAGERWDLSTRVGRLACIAAGKPNCLVLDFAGNTRMLGPVNDPRIPNKKKKGGPQDAPVKECEQCHTLNHCSVRFCIFCKMEFPPPKFKVATTAFSDELIVRKKDKEPEKLEQVDFKIDLVEYSKHDPASMRFRSNWSSPPSLKVTYNCGLRKFVEMVNVEHTGEITKEYVRKWWMRASTSLSIPKTVDEAIALAHTLKPAKSIRVHINKKPHPEILHRQYE